MGRRSRFIAFLHWQDALFEMLKIDFHGGLMDGGELTPVTQIYELQTGDGDLSSGKAVCRGVERACYLVFAWEILESCHGDEEGSMRPTTGGACPYECSSFSTC